MNKQWKGRLAQRLKRVYGDVPPNRLFIDRAIALRHMHRIPGPPFDPIEYANALRIPVEDKEMALDGFLRMTDGGFVIFVKAGTNFHRKRFTICHEIAHTFFYDLIDRDSQSESFDVEEERLCDLAASELLMPAETFLHDIEHAKEDGVVTPRTILRLAENYNVSIQAAAIRVHSLLRNVACSIWSQSEHSINLNWITPLRLEPLILCQTGKSSIEQVLKLNRPGEIVVAADSYYCRNGTMIRKRTSSMRLASGTVFSVIRIPKNIAHRRGHVTTAS